MNTLSPRLKLIFDQLRPQRAVWDLCCDHGYLGLHAYSSQQFSAEQLPHELTGNLVIAGVGSYTIFQILQTLHTQQRLKADRIIICPQNEVVSLDEIKKMPDFSYRQLQETYSVLEKDRLRKVFIFDLVTS